jgi:hypothetical protein
MANRELVIEVPEAILLAEKTDEIAFANELRLLAAIKLYELGRLSPGRAADLAGMAVGAHRLQSAGERLRAAGLRVSTPQRGTRVRPDGRRLEGPLNARARSRSFRVRVDAA